VWVTFVVVAVAIGRAAGTHKLSDADQDTGETARAQAIFAKANFNTADASMVNEIGRYAAPV